MMKNASLKCCFVIALTLFLVFGFSLSLAQSPVSDSKRREALQKELSELEKKIKEQEALVDKLSTQKRSLQRDINLLNARIRKSELSIKQRSLTIRKIQNEIKKLNGKLSDLDLKLKREKESLAKIIRKTREIDDYSLVEILLSKRKISDFFDDLSKFDSIKRALNQSFKEIESTKLSIKDRKEVLEEKKAEESRLRELQRLEKAKIERAKREKATILKVTEGQESKYKEYLKYAKRTASEIRAMLFSLRDAKGIPFGKAYEYAKEAGRATGVRPALILGIIAQESDLGKNVGTGTWRKDMHPTRDRPLFLQITKELGLDPDKMPVSKKPWYGWGGAMGPAQFIPSTWVLYKDRIAKLSGENPPNPWNPRTAFFATALLLKDNGAAAGTRYAERLAALRYFAGWKNARKRAYAFYGDGVMEHADNFQRQIDILEGKR